MSRPHDDASFLLLCQIACCNWGRLQGGAKYYAMVNGVVSQFEFFQISRPIM